MGLSHCGIFAQMLSGKEKKKKKKKGTHETRNHIANQAVQSVNPWIDPQFFLYKSLWRIGFWSVRSPEERVAVGVGGLVVFDDGRSGGCFKCGGWVDIKEGRNESPWRVHQRVASCLALPKSLTPMSTSRGDTGGFPMTRGVAYSMWLHFRRGEDPLGLNDCCR